MVSLNNTNFINLTAIIINSVNGSTLLNRRSIDSLAILGDC